MLNGTKKITALLLAVLLIISLSVTVYAASNVKEEHLVVGEKKSLPFSQVPYVSSDTSVIRIENSGGKYKYYAVAVGVGTAEVTGGKWMGDPSDDYLITVHHTELGAVIGKTGTMFFVIAAALLLFVVEILYIFFEAPKCGMSRLWALAPIISNILGFIIFIIIRSKHKANVRARKITCPTCGGACNDDTVFCPMCGTRLR